MPRFRSTATTILSLALASLAAPAARAQHAHEAHDDHDDDHEHLHFSHPLVTESPSPDTKLRVDYLWTRTDDGSARTTDRGVRVEGEYAFGPGLSLAVTVPYVWRSATALPGTRGLGNTEVALKAASLRWGEQGVLVGGGLSAGLPTGSDERGIGTSRAVELEPFVDVGYQTHALQLVAFGHYGTTIRNPAGVEAERELALDGSALYPVSPSLEALIELEAARSVGGDEHTTATSLAPGLKVYPFPNRRIMFGVSVPLGLTGAVRDSRGLLVAVFYHF